MGYLRISILVLMVLIMPAPALAEKSFLDQFVDPTDDQLDMSEWLKGQTGFLPVPIFISDPAVGYGGGLAIAFFHESCGSQCIAGPASHDFSGGRRLHRK